MNLDTFSPYVRLATHSVIAAPFKLKEHIIFDFKLIFVADGSFILNYNGEEFLCKKNDVIFIPPDVEHSISSFKNLSVSQPHIHFDVIYEKSSPDIPISFIPKSQMTREEKLLIRENTLSVLPTPILKISDIELFKKLFYDVLDAFSSKKPLYELACKQKMLKLLEYILQENIISKSRTNLSEIAPETILEMIKDYIDQNYHNDITLDKLQEQFSYNKFYISRLFTQNYSISIMKYYRTLKLDAAKQYLRDKMSITQISQKLSFSSIYAFSRFFKTYEGISPTEYLERQNRAAQRRELPYTLL